AVLFKSIRKLLSLPPQTRLFMCHDYPPSGRDVRFETTVREEREQNIHVHDGIDEERYVEMRTNRDRGLAMPILILPAVQINIRAGHFPPVEDNGTAYVKIPLNAL
ncbi:MAG: MBL fold metallo-hydrolase, partial [Fluviibacter sp.]